MPDSPSSFFVAGGTVPAWSPSYIERRADRELYEALLAGETCCVLNCRQMGKSSLAVRTIARLKEAGVATAFVDLTRLGGITVTPDQWYAGLLVEVGRALGLRKEAGESLKESREMPGVQRLLSFLSDVVLARIETPVVLMIDEIDAVRSLPYSTDDFFAGLRQIHNGRTTDPNLGRLTICLLGAALPGDLVRDPRTTPYNVGRRIELRDFTPEEACPFATALGSERLSRLLYWTSGHPFLTQSLGADLGETGDVDSLVLNRYFADRARETDTNLADVARRLQGEGDPGIGDSERADALTLYDAMLRGKDVADDESNPAAARIKMSGIARVESGKLRVRNRIYATAFDRDWVRAAMPDAEMRRQRRAFWRGVLRAGLVGGAATVAFAILSFVAIGNARRANAAEVRVTRERDSARLDAYAATMQTMEEARSKNDLLLIRKRLPELRNVPGAGWEWKFWNRVVNRHESAIPAQDGYALFLPLSPDGRLAIAWNGTRVRIIDFRTRRMLWEQEATPPVFAWLRDSKRMLVRSTGGKTRIVDAFSGRTLREGNVPIDSVFYPNTPPTLPGDRIAFYTMPDGSVARLNLETLGVTKLHFDRPVTVSYLENSPLAISRDGKVGVWILTHSPRGPGLLIADPNTGRTLPDVPLGEPVNTFAISPDGSLVACGGSRGLLALIDTKTAQIVDKVRLHGAASVSEFSSDGKHLLAGEIPSMAIRYEIRDRKLVERQRIPGVTGSQFLPDEKRIIVVDDNIAHIYRFSDEADVPRIAVPGEEPILVGNEAISRDGADAVFTPLDGSGPPRRLRMEVPWWPTYSKGLLFQKLNGRMRLFDTRSGKVLRWFPDGLNDMSWGNATSPDGKWVAYQSPKGTLHVYRLDRDDPPRTIRIEANLAASCFSWDGRLLAVSGQDGSLRMYQTKDMKLLWKHEVGGGWMRCLDFSPDNARMVTSGQQTDLFTWDARTGKMLTRMTGHHAYVGSCAWSPDGKRIASASSDSTVRLWDADTGRDFGIIGQHDVDIANMAFLPSGRTIASVDVNGLCKLWMTDERR